MRRTVTTALTIALTGGIFGQEFRLVYDPNAPFTPPSFGPIQMGAISNDGNSFAYSEGVFRTLCPFGLDGICRSSATLPGFPREITALANDGTFVGGDGVRAFAGGAFGGLRELLPPPEYQSLTQPTISDDGTTIAFGAAEASQIAVVPLVHRDGIFTQLPVPDGTTFAEPATLSVDGTEAFGSLSIQNGQSHWLARWDDFDSQPTLVAELLTTDAVSSFDVTDSTPTFSKVIGEVPGDNGYGFVWTPDRGIQRYADTAAGGFLPEALSDDGNIVVGTLGNSDGTREAAIDFGNGPQFLEDYLLAIDPDLFLTLVIWDLSDITDISGDGRRLVGNSIDLIGQETAWLLEIPAPGTTTAVALALLAGFRRRR
jgi:hypothetical protein